MEKSWAFSVTISTKFKHNNNSTLNCSKSLTCKITLIFLSYCWIFLRLQSQSNWVFGAPFLTIVAQTKKFCTCTSGLQSRLLGDYMISSSVNVGKYTVEEKITLLGIACVACRLTVSLLISSIQGWCCFFSCVPSGFSRLTGWGLSCPHAPHWHVLSHIPQYFQPSLCLVLSHSSWEWVDGDLSMCV